jgi:hypothetical protein
MADKTPLTPAQAEIIRQHRAKSNPSTVLTQAQYNELANLYQIAEASSKGNINKVTDETKAFQKRYHELLPKEATRILSDHSKTTNKGINEKLAQFDLEGNVDGMFGPRTKQYWQAVQKPGDSPTAPDNTQLTIADNSKPDEALPPIGTNPIIPQLRGKDAAPWWLQDIIGTAGAAFDLANIKRYQPWQATPEVRVPDVTFYDPTRQLAANSEQANMAYQAQTAFTNPQQLAAASSVIQGQAAKNAADTLGQYNNLNVGLANQFSDKKTDILNQASQNKANLDTQLWDKYTILNQQFDNSKAMARQNLRQQFINGITNRANTANLNSLYPQYAVNPLDGGMAYFKGDNSGIQANPNYDHGDINTKYNEALKLTGDPDRALKLLQLQMKGNTGSHEAYSNT